MPHHIEIVTYDKFIIIRLLRDVTYKTVAVVFFSDTSIQSFKNGSGIEQGSTLRYLPGGIILHSSLHRTRDLPDPLMLSRVAVTQ